MTTFTYHAINAQGVELKGELHAPDLDAARDQLRQRGLLPQQLASSAGEDGERGQARFKKVDAEVAADLLAPVRNDDRGGRERRQRVRRRSSSRPSDKYLAPGDRRDPLRRRGRA